MTFESQVLDIAYLLNLKLMKDPKFKPDKKFIMLHLKILIEKKQFKAATTFINDNGDHFTDKVERQHLEAYLFMENKNYVVAINTYFSMLRPNHNIDYYVDMSNDYKNLIRIICDDYLPKNRKQTSDLDPKEPYEMKEDLED